MSTITSAIVMSIIMSAIIMSIIMSTIIMSTIMSANICLGCPSYSDLAIPLSKGMLAVSETLGWQTWAQESTTRAAPA